MNTGDIENTGDIDTGDIEAKKMAAQVSGTQKKAGAGAPDGLVVGTRVEESAAGQPM